MTGPLALRVRRENFAVPLHLAVAQFDGAILAEQIKVFTPHADEVAGEVGVRVRE